MAQSKAFADASHALNDLSHALALLESENAKLRNDLEDANNQAEEVCIENAKLRELVRDMHKALFSLNLDHCQACPREDACVFMHKSFDCGECAFERDMRELGVEVDA